MPLGFGGWLTPYQIEQKVIDLVAEAQQRFALLPGCSGTEACRRMGLTWRRGQLATETDGFWTDHLIMVNRAVTWPPRVEFTLFHEIMHYLLDEDGELIEFYTNALKNDQRAYLAAIERCCNQGAAEFLMPQAKVRHLIAERGFTVALVEDLAAETGASLVAAAAQIAVCAPIECFVMICSREPSPRVGWFVEYAFAPSRNRYPLARFTQIPSDHLIVSAANIERIVRERSFVPFRSGTRMPCECEVVRVGSRMIAILKLGSMPALGQQALPLF